MLNRRALIVSSAAVPAAVVAATVEGAGVRRTEWRDGRRNRTLPVLLRLPPDPAPAPLVVVSHGLGGSRDGLAYLGAGLAAAGYACVHLQHPGTDIAVWQGMPDARAAMGAALGNVGAAVARLRDIGFAIDTVLAGAEPALRGRVDTSRIALAGHSYGAWTATHVVGERLPLGGFGVGWGLGFPDRRVAAAVALSPIPPLATNPAGAFGSVTAPVLYVTGTQDHGWGASNWRARTAGYQYGTNPRALAVFAGAHHASFAGEADAGAYWDDPTYQDRTVAVSRVFLDATLRGDPAARRAVRPGAAAAGAGLHAPDTWEVAGFA